jgi:hypothetical protein
VYAVRNPDEPTAASMLERMGFTAFGEDETGEVYVWHG